METIGNIVVPGVEELLIREGDPVFTNTSHGLQYDNQLTLFSLLNHADTEIPKGIIVDAGCGDGLFEALAPSIIFDNRDIGGRMILGIDKEKKKVDKARLVAREVARDYKLTTSRRDHSTGKDVQILIAEPCDISRIDTRKFMRGDQEREFPNAGLIWSNSMFHWLRSEDQKFDALNNFYNITCPDGILCLSMSSTGTAQAFLEAYQFVYKHIVGKYHRIHNPRGYIPLKWQDDPIGSLNFDIIYSLVESCGYEVVKSINAAEGRTYTTPDEYVDAVAVYGYEKFFEALPDDTPANMKRRIWSMIRKQFLENLKKQGWHPERQGEYRQFNSYLVGVRSTRMDISKVLKPGYIRGLYRALPGGARQEMKIDLEGAPVKKGIESLVNLDEIFRAFFDYFAKDSTTPDNPSCRIRYLTVKETVEAGEKRTPKDKEIFLDISSQTRNERSIENILGKKLSEKLKRRHVTSEYNNLENSNRLYSFRIPLLLN